VRTLVIQSYRREAVPQWIDRCLASVAGWARLRGYDYLLTGDEAFALCGTDYLAQVGDNKRSITNLCRLELLRNAHRDGYERAVWLDADVLVFDPGAFAVTGVRRYAFARETYLSIPSPGAWRGISAVNNSAIVCMRGEPDLDFLIAATRHVAAHRQIRTNYQVGGDLIKGLRASLQFETLGDVAMLSHGAMRAIVQNAEPILRAQARLHGTPVHAANLCATENYTPPLPESDTLRVIDVLLATAGGVINRWLDGWSGTPLPPAQSVEFRGPDVLPRPQPR